MTSDELNQELKAGNVDTSAVDGSSSTKDDTSASTTAPTTPTSTSSPSIDQFIPILTGLQSVQRVLSAPPSAIPQTFQDQIQFVYTAGVYYLYLYFNNQWNSFAGSGGGGGVTQLIAGTGISISPSGGTGTVTINASGGSTTYISAAGVTNRVTSDPSGTQTIAHGLGIVPEYVRIMGHGNPTGSGASVFSCSGVYSSTLLATSTQCTWNYSTPGATSFAGQQSGYIIYFSGATPITGQEASITVDSTNIYLLWTRLNGGVGGTFYFTWEASAAY